MESNRSHGWRTSIATLCVLSASLTVGCASAPSMQPSVVSTAESSATRSRSNHVTGVELQSVQAPTTLDAVRRLHPEFLRPSMRMPTMTEQTGPSGPSVYVNRTYVGDVSWLSSIPAAEVRDIAFLHPAEARIRFGASCVCDAGVLFVQTDSRLP